jgi:hypothetical protein
MKSGRKISSLPRESNGTLHFRLCHICLYLNEASEEILGCKKCGEAFAEPNDPHAKIDIQEVAAEANAQDPFEDWDSDEEEGESNDSHWDEMEYTPNPRRSRLLEKLYGLCVRW